MAGQGRASGAAVLSVDGSPLPTFLLRYSGRATESAASSGAKKHMLHLISQNNVKLVDIWFVDIRGRLKSLVVPVEHLESALKNGVVLNGASLIGPAGTARRGIIARLEPDSVRILPWRLDTPYPRVGTFCHMLAGGGPFDGDPREVLRKNLRRAARSDRNYNVRTTMKFLLRPSATGEGPIPAYRAGSFRKELTGWLGNLGIAATCRVHEGDAGRQEVALNFTDAYTTADNLVLLRLTVWQLCLRHGLAAHFSAGPVVNGTGHVSKAAGPHAMSLRRHAAEIAAITGSRLTLGTRPTVCRGQPALSGILRERRGEEKTSWLETRFSSACYNPYLVFTLLLAATLEAAPKTGEHGPGVSNTIEECVVVWPPGREQAIELLERSELVRRALGRTLHEAVVTARKMEFGRPAVWPDRTAVCLDLCGPDGDVGV